MVSWMAPSEPVRQQFAAALHRAFLAGLAASVSALLGALFLPPVDMSPSVPAAIGEQMIEAEMANLRPEDEPMAVPRS